MKNEDKKSVLNESIIEYEQIMEAARKNAEKKLADEFPEKFNSLLKEELKKNDKNESEEKDVVSESKDSKEKEVDDKADINDDKKSISEMKNADDKKAKKLNEAEHGEEEFLSADDIKKEIEDMDDLAEKAEKEVYKKERGPKGRFKDSEKLSNDREIYKKERGKEGEFEDSEKLAERDKEIYKKERGPEGEFEDSERVVERDREEPEITDAEIEDAINEYFDDDSMTDEDDFDEFEFDKFVKDFDALEAEKEVDPHKHVVDKDVDEGHGITHARRRGVDGKLPRKDQGLPSSHKERLRYAMREGEEKKQDSLINENKKITKKLNEYRKKEKAFNDLAESYKTAIAKYRNQLKEMALFNTNLAHVNSLFINENISLTQEDKVKIINEFKNANTIKKSEEKYKSFLNEFKENKKKPIDESIEDKFSSSSSIQPSSKNKLDEVVEKKVYENDGHLKKIKGLMETLDKRDGKKII